jgi:hypothetical protein
MIGVFLAGLLLIASPFDGVELARCTGCSCRGGPGYRAQDGKCVGWKDLARKCGDPPTTRCADERDGRRSDKTKDEEDD